MSCVSLFINSSSPILYYTKITLKPNTKNHNYPAQIQNLCISHQFNFKEIQVYYN